MPPKGPSRGAGSGKGGKGKAQAPASAPRTPQKGKAAVQLEYERTQEEASSAAPRPVALRHRVAPAPPLPSPAESLAFMALDIVETEAGRFNVWGKTAAGASVLLRLHGFRPYLFCAAPQLSGAAAGQAWDERQLQRAKGFLNLFLPTHSRIERAEAAQRKPLLFYRPDAPEGGTYLKLTLPTGGSVAAAAAALQRAMVSEQAQEEGFVWRELNLYETDEVNRLLRFLVDTSISGAAWLCLPPAPPLTAQQLRQPEQWEVPGSPPSSPQSAGTSGSGGGGGGSPAGQPAAGLGWRPVPDSERISSCDVEAIAPWQALCCLSPDATQLADPLWSPYGCLGSSSGGGAAGSGFTSTQQQLQRRQQALEPAVQEAAEAARRGDIAGLRMAVVDVLSATADGADRCAVASRGDPVVAISCTFFTFAARGHQAEAAAGPGGPAAAQQAQQQAAVAAGGEAAQAAEEGEAEASSGSEGDQGDGSGEEEAEEEQLLRVTAAAAAAGGPAGLRPHRRAAPTAAEAAGRETLLFLLHPTAAAQRQEAEERSAGPGGTPARVLLFKSEAELLLTWIHVLRQADPDVIGLFQVNDTLAVLQERFAALRLERGALQLSRLRSAKPVAIRKITNYSVQWVKNQQRLSAGSNQETWRADIDGRLVVDVVRQAVAQGSLASFSFADCVQSLLGETIEALRPCRLAALAGLAGPAQQAQHAAALPPPAAAEADALRLARYALRRCEAVCGLLRRLATVPELVELARACGLTLSQAAYNGAMLRVHSLLLRTARRQGFLVPHQGKEEKGRLQETTFIMRPKDDGTVGLYSEPVAVLDFASLYPSIYRAHNLCYSTLLHRSDVARLPPDSVTIAPTGEAFVKPGLRPGVLPGLLRALVVARAATREQLKQAADPATRAVLDARQRALKITANAVYGFTGTEVSPLQSVIVGDACLAYGRTSCERARDVLHAAAADGRLGPDGVGAQVIYAHTDSLFVKLPNASDAKQAIALGKQAGQLVSASFPPPMELKFERVCQPFLLLFTNRYAGRAFEREDQVVEGGGELVAKGIRSMWRQSSPILRTTLTGALDHILMRGDVRGAGQFVAGEVRRLLSGRAELSELVMTGGLWRLPGQEVARAAEGGPASEDVRGPHAALAVRLTQRDPGRVFVLGQRVPYVLLAGHKKQDDAAEDPLTAAEEGRAGDLRLYWENKMMKPLREVFDACLLPGAQQAALLEEVFGGEHTRIAVDALPPPPPALGPASPKPGGLRGAKSPGQQPGMASFFKPVPKCLACRSSMAGWKGPLEDAPGLCDSCAGTPGKWEETYLSLLDEQSAADARQSAAYAACRACHSGGMLGPVLCQNGECPVTYARLACSSRLRQLDQQLRRMGGEELF